jgi:hypothetical protein
MNPTIPPTIRTLFADLMQQVETAPPAGSVYRRARDGSEYLYAEIGIGTDRVDRFLGRKGDAAAEVLATGLRRGAVLARERRAQQHLAWLIAEPSATVALWGDGIAVTILQPVRFAIHKLLPAHRPVARGAGSAGKSVIEAQRKYITPSPRPARPHQSQPLRSSFPGSQADTARGGVRQCG